MADPREEWRPGSFTKNFSWGPKNEGLRELHETIRIGFDGRAENTTRAAFRERVDKIGRPDYIPLNFFLLNKLVNGIDYIIADELVFNAINFEHNRDFDKLAIFAFNFSYVGAWKGALSYQRQPALWARAYIADRVAGEFNWDTSRINANDIQNFVSNDKRYTGKTTRKLSTNLNYLYSISGIESFKAKRVERWWVDALFLAMDRTIASRADQGRPINQSQYADYLTGSYFHTLSGRRSLEKDLAARHLITLYVACGGHDRFSEEAVTALHTVTLPDIAQEISNRKTPTIAIHPSNVRIAKSIPRVCAMLARYAGFFTIDADSFEDFDVDQFIRGNLQEAIQKLSSKGIQPNLSADELMRLMRG
ncbi:hypothetical protein [Mesorhizobium sp. B2-8-3]|uniref:hypothetical protein n=1 Tax=Mesorhizobium sp. B2-8-3 TaxID=2589905 RepID=UPI00112869D8|nr:hypothetical protein [Mesorhizobium sp. B2-8-3]TPJ32451.1 hypothetical protein FJ418_19000 [Mesorhizobium sp. B2-8-3]